MYVSFCLVQAAQCCALFKQAKALPSTVAGVKINVWETW
ncbi:hypothetical protein APS_0914 [Acetobacter pasteurianus subsp. pasteurianus LMG 1262 = NBRC 106471]|nr:hypothetical protein APS_0914 [Acetobacter pasteurianus subsp. pasteurianus LMG 1262 = NBRC 106471]